MIEGDTVPLKVGLFVSPITLSDDEELTLEVAYHEREGVTLPLEDSKPVGDMVSLKVGFTV